MFKNIINQVIDKVKANEVGPGRSVEVENDTAAARPGPTGFMGKVVNDVLSKAAGKPVDSGFKGFSSLLKPQSILSQVMDEDENKKPAGMKKGGMVKKTKKFSSGGSVGSASKRGDGCAQRGKTKGKIV